MPWVRLDDRFPSHRKIRLLSHQAFRLYVSGLCYAAENLTDGRIPAEELRIVADIKTSKAAAKELVERGLWEVSEEGGWSIHDYLEYNPGSDQVRAERDAKTARQQRWRENKKKQRTEQGAPGVDGAVDASTDASRDGGVTPAPSPSPNPVLPTEVPPPPTPSVDTPGAAVDTTSGRGEVQPLIDAMGARQMRVSWGFSAAEWLELRDAIRRVGIPALVDHAARAWQAAKNTPYSARYFLPGWTGLQDAPQYTGPRSLTAGPPSKTSAYLESMAAIADELRAAEGGTQ
ncbi:hypothetical protein [Streptomyces sp. NPDC018352]|uniref:hypothetical protein n=1 Tax=Streptomyces sp. NPDC018352 TaxID=3157194 RepID=UPI0033C41C7B